MTVPFTEIVVYFDGSFHHSQDSGAGAGVAAFVRVHGYWTFAGAIGFPLTFAKNSYQAEQGAGITAVKFAYDLIKVSVSMGGSTPACAVVFDSMTVGKQAEGRWSCRQCPHLGSLMRSITRLCSSCFGCDIFFQHDQHVRGHVGEPGNELVDWIADLAATSTTPFDDPQQDWINFIQDVKTRSHLEWSWMLFEDHYHSVVREGVLHLPGKPTQDEVIPSLLPHHDTGCPQEAGQHCDCKLRFGTWNVQSILSRRADREEYIEMGPSRFDCILRQVAEANIQIFALQETRMRTSSLTSHEGYQLFYSEADAKGRYGIIVGLASDSPICRVDAKPRYLARTDVFYIHQGPRRLILKVDCSPLKFVLLALHAPHSGYSAEELQTWWSDSWKFVPLELQAWPCILLADANATTGAFPSQHIGAWAAAPHDEKAQPFHDFVTDSDTFLPSTFEELHRGDSHTWTHTRGNQRRIDYIGLPMTWKAVMQRCQSQVHYDADAGREHVDHQLVTADCHLVFQTSSTTSRIAKPFKLSVDIDPEDSWNVLSNWRDCPWSQDVHSHAGALQSQLDYYLRPFHQTKQVKQPRKTTMSQDTWTLVQEKRRCRSTLHELHDIQNTTLMSTLFSAWKGVTKQRQIQDASHLDKLLVPYDVAIATALERFRSLGGQVTHAIREDDQKFYSGLLSDGAELLHPKDVKRFWGVIRRSLPKHRVRKKSLPPLQQEGLAAQWDPHFSQLEVGQARTEVDLLQSCQLRQDAQLSSSLSQTFELSDIPSLADFEDALRNTQPHKATGFDILPSQLFHQYAPELAKIYYPLLLKIVMWRTEPAQFKGGPMALLHKRGAKSCITNYRGTLLLPTVAKRLRALLRKKLIGLIPPQRPVGQLGGFPGQHVQFGSHWARTVSTIFAKHKLNHGTLFIDLTNAFHRLVRETVTGVASEADFGAVLATLDQEAVDSLQQPHPRDCHNLLEKAGCPPALLQLLRDIHTDTWCTIANNVLLRTRRGTRPGSPLADVIFHILMQDVSQTLHAWLAAHEGYRRIIESLDIDIPMIIWADDLAITFAAGSCEELLVFLDDLTLQVHRTFLLRGFDINYAIGKTNAIIAFQGPGAAAARKQYLLVPSPHRLISLGTTTIRLPLVNEYKHLGTIICASLQLDVEIKTRIGVALTAFRQLSRPILCNRRLPVTTRLRLFHALVGSKLFFGLGSWPTLQGRSYKTLQTAYLGMIRKVLRLGLEGQHMTTAQVLAKAQAPCLRTKQALDRLLYACKLFEVGPAPLQHLLHLEAAQDPDSWLHGLHADLQWVLAIQPESIPHGGTFDFTKIVDFWQQPDCPWKAILRRARKKHLLHKSIMATAHSLHRSAFSILRQGEAVFDPDPQALTTGDPSFHCKCGRVFTTSQGLAAHRRLKHGSHAQEYELVDGATCPACLKYFWFTNRLALHLSYVPRGDGINHCFHTLKQAGYKVDRQCVTFPKGGPRHESQGSSTNAWPSRRLCAALDV